MERLAKEREEDKELNEVEMKKMLDLIDKLGKEVKELQSHQQRDDSKKSKFLMREQLQLEQKVNQEITCWFFEQLRGRLPGAPSLRRSQ